MSNNYFQFKKFTIEQSGCAMKVGTDGCLLGSWFDCSQSRYILDIGTGSGLIAIMAAQRCKDAYITGIEIDVDAANQAKENVKNSPWRERIEIVTGNLLDYNTDKLFDTIVSNPPYFVNSLKCDNDSRTLARHNDSLDCKDFFKKTESLLRPGGKIYIIIPCDIFEEWNFAAIVNGFSPTRAVYIKTTPRKQPKRVMVEFGRENCTMHKEETLVLETEPGVYSKEAQELLRDFYLKIV